MGTVDPGAAFSGAVNGNGGTLELAAGTGTLGGIGASTGFYKFQTLTVDAGGSWTLTGSNTIANIADQGSLVLKGALPSTSVQLGAAGGGGTLEAASAPGTASPINFLGASELIVDSASAFGANVGASNYTGPLLEHFGASDAVDIHNFALANALFNYSSSTGLLQISNGSQKATLDFQNSTLGAGSFHLASDSSSGILVTIS
jgi:hypothetical protein